VRPQNSRYVWGLLPIAKEKGQHIQGKFLVVAALSVAKFWAVPCVGNSVCEERAVRYFVGMYKGYRMDFFICVGRYKKDHLVLLALHREVEMWRNCVTWNVRRWTGYRMQVTKWDSNTSSVNVSFCNMTGHKAQPAVYGSNSVIWHSAVPWHPHFVVLSENLLNC
jgi:hypothetical protein